MTLLIVRTHCYSLDNKVHVANMGPTWVLSAPGGPHVFPMNLAMRVCLLYMFEVSVWGWSNIRLIHISFDLLYFFLKNICVYIYTLIYHIKESSRKYSQGASLRRHHSDIILGAMASQITSLTVVYSTVYSGADQGKHQSYASLADHRKHQSYAPLAFVRWPVNSPHKWPVTQKMFPFDDVIITPGRLMKTTAVVFIREGDRESTEISPIDLCGK